MRNPGNSGALCDPYDGTMVFPNAMQKVMRGTSAEELHINDAGIGNGIMNCAMHTSGST